MEEKESQQEEIKEIDMNIKEFLETARMHLLGLVTSHTPLASTGRTQTQ